MAKRFLCTGLIAQLSTLSACVSVQAIEVVQLPPHQFRADTNVAIEFGSASMVGLRCAKRGATFLGLPALNASGCADARLITVLDPCQTLTAGDYAAQLCAALRLNERISVARGNLAPHPDEGRWISASFSTEGQDTNQHSGTEGRPLTISFVSVARIQELCGSAYANACATGAGVFAANPCAPAPQNWYRDLLCHELGHANGWSASHDTLPKLSPASASPEAMRYLTRMPDKS